MALADPWEALQQRRKTNFQRTSNRRNGGPYLIAYKAISILSNGFTTSKDTGQLPPRQVAFARGGQGK